jgi:1-hydroxycarotenoid 3,4-desaturase
LRVLLGMGVMPSLWRSLGQHFRDPRLQQLFGRYATYCGSSPWQAPATLMLIAQVEMDGVWSVHGGMHALAQCLARLGAQRGVQFRYGESVQTIITSQGRASGVQLASGETIAAQAVVFNGDVAALRAGLLGGGALPQAVTGRAPQRSLSAITWSINAPTSGFALERHNVFFQDDYASEFTDIFDRARLPQKPTVYVCAQDRGLADTPMGPERLLCLVNAPALGDSDTITPEAIDQCEQASFQWLQRCGLQVSLQARNHVRTTPAQFHQLFPATGGALYGQATHGWMSAFARSNSASRIPGLFLAGGSVHPGPGVPMAALSGQLAAEAVMARRASTKRFHPVPISGGMSTP